MRNVTESRIEELNLVVFTVEPDAVFADMRDAIDEYYHTMLTKYIMVDFSKVKNHLTSEEIMKIGQQMNVLGRARKGGFDLIVVPSLLQYGLGRMYSAYVEEIDPQALQTRVFRSKEQAIAWLKVNEVKGKFNK
jgi:hypothetical protein